MSAKTPKNRSEGARHSQSDDSRGSWRAAVAGHVPCVPNMTGIEPVFIKVRVRGVEKFLSPNVFFEAFWQGIFSPDL